MIHLHESKHQEHLEYQTEYHAHVTSEQSESISAGYPKSRLKSNFIISNTKRPIFCYNHYVKNGFVSEQ